MSAATRKYVYTLLVALGTALVFYGVISGEELAVWLNVASTALFTGGVILARQNVPAAPRHLDTNRDSE